jgi:hypothetical protein
MTDEIRPPGAGEPPARSFYPRRWASLGLLLAAVFMDMVDSQIVTIALPWEMIIPVERR